MFPLKSLYTYYIFASFHTETTISDKNYGKNSYLDNFLFLPPSPLNNVEKKRAKLMSSDVMGSQHCIGGEGIFKHIF